MANEALKEPIAMVGGLPYYGNAAEAVAMRLNPGDPIEFKRRGSADWIPAVVELVWFYDCVCVAIKGTHRQVYPGLGDEIRPLRVVDFGRSEAPTKAV